MQTPRMTGWALFCALALVGCGSSDSGDPDGGSDGGDLDGGTDGGDASTGATQAYVFSDFGFHYAAGAEIDGFDLDGRDSMASTPAGDECAHNDYAGPGGATGIDYGFKGFIDAFEGLQEDQIVDSVTSAAAINGSMTMLVELSGLDDTSDDASVDVQFFASEDTPPTDAMMNVLPNGTLSVHPDPAFGSEGANGALGGGVIEVGPIDVVFDFNIQIVDAALTVGRAMVRLQIQPDNTLRGIIHGYWSLDELWAIIGKPTTDNGNAAGFTAEEFMTAMETYADGDYNAGVCESVSVIYEFTAVQAFLTR